MAEGCAAAGAGGEEGEGVSLMWRDILLEITVALISASVVGLGVAAFMILTGRI